MPQMHDTLASDTPKNPDPTPVKCRFCVERFEDFETLKFHASTSHGRQVRVVDKQCAKIDAKISSLKEVADEGMIGCREDYVSDRGNRYHWAVIQGIAPNWQKPIAGDAFSITDELESLIN